MAGAAPRDAYQAQLIEEFARAEVRVEFVKGPRAEARLRHDCASICCGSEPGGRQPVR